MAAAAGIKGLFHAFLSAIQRDDLNQHRPNGWNGYCSSRAALMKLIWSINPLERDPNLLKRATSVIGILNSQGDWTIQPFVLISQFSFLPFQAPCPSTPGDTASRITDAVQKRVFDLTRGCDLKGLQSAHVILRRYHPLRPEVSELLDYARSEKADLILTATRARKGWRRWLSGSFSESLIYHSEIPVLFLNPGCGPDVRFDRIVFPTEISSDFENTLPRVIRLARKLKSEVVLFIRPMGQDVSAKRIEKWTEMAKETQVTLRFRTHTKGDFVESVLKYATESADLIAYCERSRQEDYWRLERETRRLVRNAPCPVLVFYPEKTA